MNSPKLYEDYASDGRLLEHGSRISPKLDEDYTSDGWSTGARLGDFAKLLSEDYASNGISTIPNEV